MNNHLLSDVIRSSESLTSAQVSLNPMSCDDYIIKRAQDNNNDNQMLFASKHLVASEQNHDKHAMTQQQTINSNNNSDKQKSNSDVINKEKVTQNEQKYEIRLLVRRREAGALIGKRGANIKRMRDTYNECTFNIPDTGNGPERVVCIVSKSFALLEQILADLTQLFLEKASQAITTNHTFNHSIERSNQQLELKLLIPSAHAGALIGIGGQSIRKLRSETKAAIKIYEMCCPASSERVCAIKAKPPVIVSTIKMILDIVNKNVLDDNNNNAATSGQSVVCSVVHKPYDALNYNLSLVDKYGGYLPDDSSSSANFSSCIPFPMVRPTHQATSSTRQHHTSSHFHMQPTRLCYATNEQFATNERILDSCNRSNSGQCKSNAVFRFHPYNTTPHHHRVVDHLREHQCEQLAYRLHDLHSSAQQQQLQLQHQQHVHNLFVQNEPLFRSINRHQIHQELILAAASQQQQQQQHLHNSTDDDTMQRSAGCSCQSTLLCPIPQALRLAPDALVSQQQAPPALVSSQANMIAKRSHESAPSLNENDNNNNNSNLQTLNTLQNNQHLHVAGLQ